MIRLLLAALAVTALASSGRSDLVFNGQAGRKPTIVGPKKGLLFATPGLAREYASGELRIAMRQANVQVHLARQSANTLIASVRAEFELENLKPPGGSADGFAVAFPVSHFRPAAFLLDEFSVTVDGRVPSSAAGAFPQSQTGVQLKDGSSYQVLYSWLQSLAPGRRQHVVVSYRAQLGRQDRGKIQSALGWLPPDTVAPSVVSGLPEGSYFFFDYMLRSGATWDGPIGEEIITMTADSGVSLDHPSFIGEQPTKSGDGWTWKLKNVKPTQDVLVVIP